MEKITIEDIDDLRLKRIALDEQIAVYEEKLSANLANELYEKQAFKETAWNINFNNWNMISLELCHPFPESFMRFFSNSAAVVLEKDLNNHLDVILNMDTQDDEYEINFRDKKILGVFGGKDKDVVKTAFEYFIEKWGIKVLGVKLKSKIKEHEGYLSMYKEVLDSVEKNNQMLDKL